MLRVAGRGAEGWLCGRHDRRGIRRRGWRAPRRVGHPRIPLLVAHLLLLAVDERKAARRVRRSGPSDAAEC